MSTHASKIQDNNSRSVAATATQVQSSEVSSLEVADNRAEAVAQRKLQGMADDSPQVVQQRSYQGMANNSPQAKQAVQLQAMTENSPALPIQKKKNNTGLPDNLKSGIENL